MWWKVSKLEHESDMDHIEAEIENQQRWMQAQIDAMKESNELLFDNVGESFQSIEELIDKKVEYLENVIGSMQTDVDKVIQSVIQHIDELNKRQDKIETSLKALLSHQEKKLSNEPWIEVLGGDVDSDKGLELNLDWNDAFIEQLRAQGYTGSSDSTLIGKYLLQLGDMVSKGQDNV